ncbi:MAG: DUF1573 domain-containing protein [Ignavibacteria bacterium]|nr:DUF1573 domain-containing protein [Ignavibacteria bacterium]
MKKKIFFLLLILASFTLAQKQGPKITSSNPNFDFGEILDGQIVNHTFEIQNIGGEDLKIDKVQASCGCTAAQPAKKVLKPGEKTTIRVEFDSSDRMGAQHKAVYVFSNDANNPQFQLAFTALVVDKLTSPPKDSPKLVLSLYQYDFGQVEEGKIYEAKIGFKNEGKSILEIKDVKTSCGCTAALLSSKKLKAGESGSLKIELDTANREGKLVRTITLNSNDPANQNQTITITANIKKRK